MHTEAIYRMADLSVTLIAPGLLILVEKNHKDAAMRLKAIS